MNQQQWNESEALAARVLACFELEVNGYSATADKTTSKRG